MCHPQCTYMYRELWRGLHKVSGLSRDHAAASLREAANRFVHWTVSSPDEKRKLGEALLYAAANTYAITTRRDSDRYL